jgi:ATP-dependent Clp protease ATP-binding subunit ClpB
LHCIGATTINEYRKYIEKDPALERRFQPIFVEPPSVEDTISILRGLKERYEVHHGVRIQDGALIAAATLSDRYIADRFLPDKAIDLMDEAAARLRMEIDSSPVEIDEREHRLVQLQIEEQALGQERDDASKERLQRIRQEIADLREELDALNARYERERQAINKVQGDQARLEELRAQAERAERDGNYELAARLRYGDIRELESRLTALEHAAQGNEDDLEPMLQQEVTEQDIAHIVSRWTGVPVSRLLEGEVQKLIHMEERLHERVVGQDEALRAVSNAVRRARSGLQDPHRPIGSFIFMGPTGVGKTELARALAEFLFDDERAMIRLDMSEYQERHTVARMIGAPPGYVGYDEGGQLTEAVRRRPYAVVLFDEIEKAHAEVFNALLQILDDGRLTDGKGRTVNFSNTVVIMTSNIGSQWISELGGRDDGQMRARVTEALRQRFPPEFLNRIDETIVFHALTREHLAEIVDIQLGHLRQLLAARGLGLQVTPAARQALAAEGFDPVYGARPLKRTIQRRVQDTLALELLQGRFDEGDTVVVDYIDPAYTFHAVESKAAHTMQ